MTKVKYPGNCDNFLVLSLVSYCHKIIDSHVQNVLQNSFKTVVIFCIISNDALQFMLQISGFQGSSTCAWPTRYCIR